MQNPVGLVGGHILDLPGWVISSALSIHSHLLWPIPPQLCEMQMLSFTVTNIWTAVVPMTEHIYWVDFFF